MRKFRSWTNFAVEELRLLSSVATVVFVFAFALLVLWYLKKLGCPMDVDMTGKIGKGWLWFVVRGKGVIGCYLSIVAAEFLGLYLVGRRLTH
jgi:hypothetical protein